MEDRQVTFLDYIYVLARWKKSIFWTTFLTALLSVGGSLMLPPWYQSTTVLLIPANDMGMGISSLMSQFGMGGAGGLFGQESEEIERYQAILWSRTTLQEIAERYNLQEVYEEENMERTINALGGLLDIGLTDENALYVSVEDKSPQRAADIANDLVRILEKRNMTLETEQARSNRIFIEERYNQNVRDIKSAADSMSSFQTEYNVLSLPEQIDAELKAYSDIYSQMKLVEAEYEVAQRDMSKKNPLLTRIKSELDVLRGQLRELEFSPDKIKSSNITAQYFVPLDQVPEVLSKYAQLQLNIEAQAAIFEFLTQQVEVARLQEAKEIPALQVLDEAIPPIKKSRPKRSLIVIFVTGLAFIFSASLAYTMEYFNRMGDSSDENRQKVNTVLSLFGKRPRS